jgi:hypothetical protein
MKWCNASNSNALNNTDDDTDEAPDQDTSRCRVALSPTQRTDALGEWSRVG